MIAKADTRPLTAKETSTIEYYLDPDSESYNNWCESYKKANYATSKGWKANAKRVHDKEVVKAELARRRREIEDKTEMTVGMVQAMYQEARTMAMSINQPSAAVSAVTGIARLYGMDKDNQQDKAVSPDQLSEEDMAAAKRAALSTQYRNMAKDSRKGGASA